MKVGAEWKLRARLRSQSIAWSWILLPVCRRADSPLLALLCCTWSKRCAKGRDAAGSALQMEAQSCRASFWAGSHCQNVLTRSWVLEFLLPGLQVSHSQGSEHPGPTQEVFLIPFPSVAATARVADSGQTHSSHSLAAMGL